MTLDELEAKKSKDLINPRYYEMKKAELLGARTHRECHHCKEQMRRDASVCVPSLPPPDSHPWTQNEGYGWLAQPTTAIGSTSMDSGTWHGAQLLSADSAIHVYGNVVSSKI